jgi:hypothetical protein
MKISAKRLSLISLFIFLTAFVYSLFSVYKIISTTAPDFKVYYQSTEDLLKGTNLYIDSRIAYKLAAPPNGLPLFIPLVSLPYNLAQSLFVILSLVSVFVIVFVSLKLINKAVLKNSFYIFVGFTLLSFPTKFTLGMGQINLIAYDLLLLSFYLLQKKRDRMSGVLLGLAILLKPIFVFMLLYYLAKKTWKVVSIACLVILLSSLSVLLIYGLPIYSYYINAVIPQLFNLGGREIYYNQGLTGFVSRLTPDLQLRKVLPTLLSFVLAGYLISNLIRNNKRELANFSLSLIILILIDTWSWQHHFVFLIFPFILIAVRLIKSKSKFNLMLLVVSYLLVSINIKNPLAFSFFPVNLLLSHVFIGTVMLLILHRDIFRRE